MSSVPIHWIEEPESNQDYEDLYKMSTKLLKNHEGISEDSQISFEDFNNLITERFMRFYILRVETPADIDENELSERPKKSVGYVAYMKDYDLNFGGLGILIDHFFIFPEHRGDGLGKALFRKVYKYALDEELSYIKLFYQQRDDRQAIYLNLGLKNVSDRPPFIRLFEIPSPGEIRKHLHMDVLREYAEVRKLYEPQVMTKQYYEGEIFDHMVYTKPIIKEYSRLPSPEFVVVLEMHKKYPNDPYNYTDKIRYHIHSWLLKKMSIKKMWNDVTEMNESHDPKFKICAFVERPIICCWGGHMLCFSNFVGDSSIIEKKVLIDRIRYWNPRWGAIRGIQFEIAGGKAEAPTAENNGIVRTLDSLGVYEDATWKCTVMDLNEASMRVTEVTEP